MTDDTKRLRDPIHGLIVFNENDPIDKLAWELIKTPEFQRLRRIRQLGVSEFVFPGATHTRFAHSIGVFHNARRLMTVIKSEQKSKYDHDRAMVAMVAALLHDLGHGPFSHAFEGAREAIAEDRGQDEVEKHEKYTAKLILAEDGGIRPILDKACPGFSLAEKAADLIRADDPMDIYHAVVSSSFDADRLDYLQRDRYMTGTGAGSIDYDWLMDNLTTDLITVSQDENTIEIPTFVFKMKGRQAAEDFLLARYRLYTQVYLHKTTRGFEQIITALIRKIGTATAKGYDLGLGITHPLIRFLMPDGGSLADYRDLDDTVVWGAIERLRRCDNADVAALAARLWNREPLRALDMSVDFGHKPEAQKNALRRLPNSVTENLKHTVFRDDAAYNLYSGGNGETTKAHKILRVRDGGGNPMEITGFPDTVIHKGLMEKTRLTRFYFLTKEDREQAFKAMRGR